METMCMCTGQLGYTIACQTSMAIQQMITDLQSTSLAQQSHIPPIHPRFTQHFSRFIHEKPIFEFAFFPVLSCFTKFSPVPLNFPRVYPWFHWFHGTHHGHRLWTSRASTMAIATAGAVAEEAIGAFVEIRLEREKNDGRLGHLTRIFNGV